MGQHLLAVRRSAAAPLLRLGGQQRQPPRVAPAQLLAAPLEACDAPQRLGARGAFAPIPRLRLDVAAAPNAAPHAPATAAAAAATAAAAAAAAEEQLRRHLLEQRVQACGVLSLLARR